MRGPDGFLYAGARLQARYGPRTSPAAWRRLGGLPEAPEWLAGLASTELHPYLAGLEPGSGAHALERELRRRFRREVEAVAHWVPTGWRASVRWTSRLPDLALLAAVARGEAPPEWAREAGSPVTTVASTALREPDADTEALLAAIAAGAWPVAAWVDLWRRRWARERTGPAASLRKLADDMVATLTTEPGVTAAGSDPLARRLERSFRRHTRDAAGAAAFLVLRWLDTRRLCAGLAQRVLPGGAGNGNAGT
ncbi:MAG TPA: hypothetical protein VFA86_11690 [Gammaproteobacteria bacterium]|nr:hypothetical protein [Gammaproteobacteria bacterium]